MQKAPMVGQDLVDYLREIFPLSAMLNQSADDVAQLNQLRGVHHVIEHLEGVVKSQTRRATESNITVL